MGENSGAQKVMYLLTAVILVLPVFLLSGNVEARTSQEIQNEIENKNKELSNTKSQIDSLENEIAASQDAINNATDGLPKIEAELKKLESEIQLNRKQYDLLVQENDLKKLEMQKKELEQEGSLQSSYQSWKSDNRIFTTLRGDSGTQYKNRMYTSQILGKGKDYIEFLASEIDDLENQVNETGELLKALDEQEKELEAKKVELETQIEYYKNVINQNNVLAAGLSDQQSQLESQISSLLVEQQQAAQKEKQQLEETQGQTGQNPDQGNNGGNTGGNNGGTPTTPAPSFYFSGQGRDLYQGHGVGMSQWGAHGMASRGVNYQDILRFYYTNTAVTGGYEGVSIPVSGYGNVNIETYAAGLAEVPDRACGSSEQAQQNPAKYVVDNPNTPWDCWPEHAIKAQVVAGRSYAMYYVNTRGTICTTAACQVYSGGSGKKWAADETRGQIVTYNGSVIEALYSSDNNQGNGTANNDTIFQNFVGDGYPIGYLRAANDNGMASATSWTYWTYRTNFNYTYASVKQMLEFTAYQSDYGAGVKNDTASILNAIGNNIVNITFERDPSGRVKKVWLHGENGVTRSIGGWWFKNIWNNWAYYVGSYDYIYSQTIYLNPV